jgi:HEAT repeat protein
MKRIVLTGFSAVVLLFAGPVHTRAQSRSASFQYVVTGEGVVQEQSGSLPTFGEVLKRHNIELTQSALIAALNNLDPEVRYLAAHKLAEDGATEAIPAIKQALASEKVPRTRMNIALALAEMGEPIGFETLEDNCKNDNTSADTRARSAEYLLRFNRDSTTCLSGVLDVLKGGSNGDKMVAAELLPRYRNLPKEDSEKVFTGLVDALHAPYDLVRIAAGRAIADFGDTRGIAELGIVIESEQDELVRSRLQEDLGILRNKIRQ